MGGCVLKQKYQDKSRLIYQSSSFCLYCADGPLE
nr:MAG TPA: hypothetical protein [Inoviridae sp.]